MGQPNHPASFRRGWWLKRAGGRSRYLCVGGWQSLSPGPQGKEGGREGESKGPPHTPPLSHSDLLPSEKASEKHLPRRLSPAFPFD